MTRPLLHLTIMADEAYPTLRATVVGSRELQLYPGLDARVSALAQEKLASVSPTFAAELEATTHFVEQLARLTVDSAPTARASELSAAPVEPEWAHTPEQIVAATPPWRGEPDDVTWSELIEGVVRRARRLCGPSSR